MLDRAYGDLGNKQLKEHSTEQTGMAGASEGCRANDDDDDDDISYAVDYYEHMVQVIVTY